MNNDSKKKAGILRNNAFQTIIASLLCIVIGLLIGYVVLLIINPKGAAGAITAILKNYFYYPSQKAMMKYMGTTLVKASALLMCSLSVLFAYKVGLFNIGAAGQYVVGAGASLYFALKLGMPWYVCMIAAVVIAALLGGISGALKAYFNVNEVISCIMLNWISLYVVNMASDPGKIRVHPIYRGSFQRKQSSTSSKLRTGSDLFRKQVRFHRSYYFCGYGNRRMGTSGENQIRL